MDGIWTELWTKFLIPRQENGYLAIWGGLDAGRRPGEVPFSPSGYLRKGTSSREVHQVSGEWHDRKNQFHSQIALSLVPTFLICESHLSYHQ